MVAIVGGLLVARFVTIQSEQDGAQQLLDDGQERLATAQRRQQEAESRLYDRDVDSFFDRDVIRAISEGKQGVADLRDTGGYTQLTDEQLTEVTQIIVLEFETARRVLKELLPQAEAASYPAWEEFKRSRTDLPETNWEEVWETAYGDLITPTQPTRYSSLLGGFNSPIPLSIIPIPPEISVLRGQRRDALRTNLDRAAQQVEDIESEVQRLRRAREAIVRPKGLGLGLVILGYFTLTGVIVPLWLMSRAPQQLTPTLGLVAFLLFFSGLIALLGYMVLLALRLSGWRRKKT